MQILFVDDDLSQCEQVAEFLGRFGHQVITRTTIHGALQEIHRQAPDVLLCDYRLSDTEHGLMLARQVRNLLPDCVILMISAYTAIENVTEALQLGLDDYLSRPITLSATYQRILDAVAKRQGGGQGKPDILMVGLLHLDRTTRIARWYGETLALSGTEFDMVYHLALRAGKVVTAVDLCALVRGERVEVRQATHLLKQPMFKLRAKLTQEGKYPQPIHNVRGVRKRPSISAKFSAGILY